MSRATLAKRATCLTRSTSTASPLGVDPERNANVEAFLQEAVYRSREAQAGAGLWAAGDPNAANCGLGESAAVVLDLTPRATELFDALWPSSLEGEELAFVRERLKDWVERQDALDRDRNHFLKGFRQKHGFDRSAYSDELLRTFETGLDGVNARIADERRALAETLLAGSVRPKAPPTS